MSTTAQVVAIISGTVGVVTLILGALYMLITVLASRIDGNITALRNEMVARFKALGRDLQRVHRKLS